MRALFASLVVLLLGLLAWWGLADRTNAPHPEDRRSADAGEAGPVPMPAPAEPRDPSRLAARPRAPRVSVEELLAQGKVGNGSLLVTLAPAAGMGEPQGVRPDVEPLDIPAAAHPLAVPQDDGTYLFERLPIGRWRVRAYVSGALDAAVVVKVAPGALTEVTVPLAPGGEAAWKVTITGEAPPETARIVLLDGRGVPMEATYRTAFTTLHAAPGKVPELPLEGRVIGLPPGTYRIRASLGDGDTDEQPFEVRAGEAPVVSLRLVKR